MKELSYRASEEVFENIRNYQRLVALSEAYRAILLDAGIRLPPG